MQISSINISGEDISVICADTIVVGSGCAGFNAADCLYNLGRRNIALITEDVNTGTSRNTGSDKQTYYKMSVAASEADSVDKLADTLWNGGSVHGDHALCEAAGSLRSFMKLVELGVSFPKNAYGEFVGYKTDHDPLQRATSCGPYTSKIMTEMLEKSVREKNIPIINNIQLIKLLCENSKIKGAVALNTSRKTEHTNHNNPDNSGAGSNEYTDYVLIICNNMILCTGGPAAIYQNSVYPHGHTGSSGLAISAGAVMNNLQEWQYGLASTKFRWNVSGTYQQALPKYIAVDKNGNQREFLTDYMTPQGVLNNVFLKGYQWPFDVNKINGSSVIDLIVYHETINKGNRVYIDFRYEPCGLGTDYGFEILSAEAREYLSRSNALLDTPIHRLERMNPKAIEMYREHGIDLFREPLEVTVCAQHNNGGISVDSDWQTSVNGLYVAGEAAGTFGIYRPGGSALNSTQVGSRRAAEHIAYTTKEQYTEFFGKANIIDEDIKCAVSEIQKQAAKSMCCVSGKNAHNHADLRYTVQAEMSECAAYLRDIPKMKAIFERRKKQIAAFFNEYTACFDELPQLYKTYDILITQAAVLSAMILSGETAGSRGSALILADGNTDITNTGTTFLLNLCMPYKVENKGYRKYALETQITDSDNDFKSHFIPVRDIPERDIWFETVWREFAERMR